MSPLKKVILFIHRWLGFISGLVVFIVSITGCLFCFQDELQDVFHSYRHVPVQTTPYLKPSILQKAAEAKVSEGKAGLVSYLGTDRAAVVRVAGKQKDMHFIYLDPYTGKFLYDENPRINFFIVVEFIHLYLLLPAPVGKVVVGTSVLIFVVIMFTGVILWWPKRKTDRKRSLTIKWNARWRRLNYDLHNVLGFYALSIATIIAITGLSMSFKWMEEGIYKAGNLGRGHDNEKAILKSDSLQKGITINMPVIDKVYDEVRKTCPSAAMYFFFEEAGAAGTLRATTYVKSLHFARNDQFSFDKYTGSLLRYLPDAKKSTGMQLNNMNYDIHVGQIWGLPGKIIAFFTSLICASLPITGFIIWLGKRKKTKPSQKKKAAALSIANNPSLFL